MSTRKTWTEKEDQTLRFLIEQQRLTKWAEIAHVMADRFGFSCNEKQCRGRYLHKLAKTVNSSPFSSEEENSLFDMQAQLGNRWAVIGTKLERTDNFVKNYFYAKLRRCMRKINKLLAKFASARFHKVETTTLYKIIETVHHNPLCRRIRDQLRKFEDEHYDIKDLEEKINFAKEVANQIADFDPKIRKNTELVEEERLQAQDGAQGEDGLLQSESYHSSNPSSHHHTINSYTSSRSNSKSNSHSHSNSHSNSSSPSFRPPHQPSTPQHLGSHHFLPMPVRIKRSHSIDSDPDGMEEEEESMLYRSANLQNRAKLKPKAQQLQAEGQEYLTSSADWNMFDQVIKIRFISPKVSPQSSSRHSSDRIEVEGEAGDFPMKESDIKEDNLWAMINQKQQEN